MKQVIYLGLVQLQICLNIQSPKRIGVITKPLFTTVICSVPESKSSPTSAAIQAPGITPSVTPLSHTLMYYLIYPHMRPCNIQYTFGGHGDDTNHHIRSFLASANVQRSFNKFLLIKHEKDRIDFFVVLVITH